MALRYYANAPATTLAASCTSGATTIQVIAVAGLPISYPYTLIVDRGMATEEAMSVTNASGTTLTVTRGIDGTTAFAHGLGASVVHGITAQDLREPNAHVNASSGVHGAAGAVVGTTDAQTLTNKTISLASNTLSGTKADFNNAVTDADFATLTGTEQLVNKDLSVANTFPSNFATTNGVQTFTNKTFDSTSPTALNPTGVILMYAANTAIPTGWLLCNGQEVSRIAYATLFAKIGTTFGVGDGTNTFNVPNLRGRVPVGMDGSYEFNTMGATGGEKTHTLTAAEMPAHSHGGTTTGTGAHGHTTRSSADAGGSTLAFLRSANTSVTTGGGMVDSSSGDHTHGIQTDGASAPHNNIQPYLVLNFIIKA